MTTSQELHLMQRMGLPTCFLNSPRDLDSDDEVCTAETHLIFHFYSFIALRHLNLKSDCVTIQMKPLPQDICMCFLLTARSERSTNFVAFICFGSILSLV